MSALSPAQRSKLCQPVDGQGELFPEHQVPRRRSVPPQGVDDVPAQRSRSTSSPRSGRR